MKFKRPWYSSQEWTADPEFVEVEIDDSFAALIQQHDAYLKSTDSDCVTHWHVGSYTLFDEENNEMKPEFRISGCDLRVYRGGQISFLFPFKESIDEGWTDRILVSP